MANFCSRCGKELEKDGFCMNCMDFARKSENVQGTATDYQAATQMPHNTESFVQNSGQWSNEAEHMMHGNMQMNEEHKTKTSGARILLAIILSVVICGAGIFIIAKFSDAPSKDSFVEGDGYTAYEVQDSDQAEYEDDFDVMQDEESDSATTFSDSSDVYEADYEMIMQAGESSNGYNLFAVKKDDIVPVMNEYFGRYNKQTNFRSYMDNTYELVDDETYTYYESYSIWEFEGEENSMYCITTDTVTSNVLYVGVYRDNKEDAIELVKESLISIDPSLSEEQLQETCDKLSNEPELVEAECSEYYVYGGYTGAEQDMYYYYIFSLVEN